MTMFDYKPILHTNIFYKFLFSYIVVILIPILGLGSLSYLLFSNSMQKEVQHNNALILSRMSETLDQKLEDTKNMMYQSVLSLSGSETDYSKLQDAITLLSRIKNTDKFIDDVFVYYPNTGVIIRSDGLYQADFFFEHFYKYEGEGLTDWLTQFPRNDFSVIPTQNVKVRDNDSEKEITFLTSFPLFNQELDGTLVVMVNSSTLQSIISNSLLATDGQSQIQIMNKNSQLISPPNLDKTIAGQLMHTDSNDSGGDFTYLNQGKVSLSYLNSRAVDWKYIVLTRTDQISKQADSIRFLTLFICLVLFLLGILLAIIISYNFSKPVYEMMNIFGTNLSIKNKSKARFNEFQVILQHLRFVMNEHRELAKDYYVKSIILGDDLERTEKPLNNSETIFVYLLYTVIVIEINRENSGYDKSSKKAMVNHETIDLIESIMTGENQMAGLLTNIGGSNISILMNFNDLGLMKKKLEFLKEQISEKSDQLYWIGVGNVYENLNQINQSYKEACMSLEYRQLNLVTQILYYADCLEIINQQIIPISVEEENQLMWSILAGDQQKVSEYLTVLFGKIHEQTTFTQLRQFGHNILGLVYQLILQNQLQKTEILAGGYDFFAVNDKFTFNELKDYLQKTCCKICDFFKTRVATRDKKLEDDIIAYIYENYNLDLSLDFIAAKFNMNPKYLSRFFKEHFGVNFLEFINQFRVKKAKELLVLDPNLKINAIADQVGISNVNTFISVFKKYEGVTPGKYRNMQNSNVG